jgi:hypothetical protein
VPCLGAEVDRKAGSQRAIRARDVRAADLQAEPAKRVERESILRHIVSSDSPKTAATRRNIVASGASHQTERALASGAIKTA